ncbi:MAG: hypothetical protein MUC50_07810 [Myxococcota bacterium]|jgi:type III secretory pathway lipoprotein EscJ|nr:hypothetical protein [Myxococcota bacterium]
MRKALLVYLLSIVGSCASPLPPERKDEPAELSNIVGTGLLVSPADEHLRREHAQGLELAATLKRLDGVRDARVHLSLPSTSPLQRSAVAEPTAAVLLLARSKDAQPNVEKARRLLVAAVPGLLPHRVDIEVSVPSGESLALVSIGPLKVAQESAFLARAILGTLLGLVLLQGAVLCVVGFRRRERTH